MADVSNAVAIGLGHFAGINDEALLVEAIVKFIEIKIISGIQKRSDDVAAIITRTGSPS